MKPDAYTKTVLTIIAAALVLNLVSPLFQPMVVKAKVADPLDKIADELSEINDNLDSIESYGLRLRGTSSSEVVVKIKE